MTLGTDIESDNTFEDIMKDILSQDNVILSVKSAGAICEANIEMNLPLRVSDQYVTIGNETGTWHMHVNILETKEARFIIENKINGRNSYSIRFFDSNGNLVLRANFVRMYDSLNTLIQERLLAYDSIFAKYGRRHNLILRGTKEVKHD